MEAEYVLMKTARNKVKKRKRLIGIKLEQFRSNDRNYITPIEKTWFKKVKDSNKIASEKVAKEVKPSAEKIQKIINNQIEATLMNSNKETEPILRSEETYNEKETRLKEERR